MTGRCTAPHKRVYKRRSYAYLMAARLNTLGREGLTPYRCPAGHWHLGRWRKQAAS